MAQTPSNSSTIVNDQLKYKGARKRKWGKYVSEISLPNSRERIWLGSYDTAEKAARAFDAALFCLRGRHAKFNFPEDPPDVSGGQSLTRAEIQAVAQHYGNSYPASSSYHQPTRPDTEFRARAMDLDEASPSDSNWAGPNVDTIDWSFWDMVDTNGGWHNASDASGYGLLPEPGDMYIPPDFASRSHEDEDNYDNTGNATSFLWNF